MLFLKWFLLGSWLSTNLIFIVLLACVHVHVHLFVYDIHLQKSKKIPSYFLKYWKFCHMLTKYVKLWNKYKWKHTYVND